MNNHRHQTLRILSILFLMISAGINVVMACTPPPECTPPSRYEMWIYDPADSEYHDYVVPATNEIVVNMMGSQCTVKFKMVPTIYDSGSQSYFVYWPELYYYGCPWGSCLFNYCNWSLNSNVHADYLNHTFNTYGTYTSSGSHFGFFCDPCTLCSQNISGGSRSATVIIRDQIEILITQYEDFSIGWTPTRNLFVTEATYQNPGNLSWAEVEDSEGEFDYAICRIAQDFQNIRNRFGGPLQVNCVYRTPSHNSTVPRSSSNSQHTKGVAMDIQLQDFNGSGGITTADGEYFWDNYAFPEGADWHYSEAVNGHGFLHIDWKYSF